METPTKNTLHWLGRTHIEHERSARWYLAAICTLFALVAFCMYTASWSFLFVIVLASLVYGCVHHKKIPPKQVTLNEVGLQYGEQFIAWQDCEYFWMLVYPDHNELHLKLAYKWNDDVTIQTANMDIEVIRKFISQFVPENTEHHEKLLDFIVRLLKI